MKYVYLVTEGPHDVATIGRILKMQKFSKVRLYDELDDYWQRIIPKVYPPDGDLLKRVPVPVFFQHEEASVAVHSAGGLESIARTLRLSVKNLQSRDDGKALHAVGVIIDADKKSATERFRDMSQFLKDTDLPFNQLSILGEVVACTPQIGIYVLPNNNDAGTLENLLVDCAEVVYPDLLVAASTYLDSVDDAYKKKWSGSEQQKALIGSISNILKPGKANQVSIEENKWISPETLEVEAVKAFHVFMNKLLN